MKRHAKILTALVTAATLGLSLAGCSNGASGGEAAGGDNSIEIWYRPGSLPTASIEGVKAQFPQADIKLIKSPDTDTKLQAALRSGRGVPDIAVATLPLYASVFDKFVDVNEHGFKDVADDYVSWKISGQQSRGRQVGIPIDIGPNGFLYRADVFGALGLPTEPPAVAEAMATWEGFQSIAEKIKASTGAYICDEASTIYSHSNRSNGYWLSSNDQMDPQPEPDTDLNRESFVRAVTIGQKQLCLGYDSSSQEWGSAIAQDKLVGYIGPAYANAQLIAAGKASSGKWRVAKAPVGYSSNFGSNLSVLKASKNPKLATDIAIWMTNAKNQAAGYKDGLFPSTPGSYGEPEMTVPEPFFGGQNTAAIFGEIAEKSPAFARSPLAETQYALFQKAIADSVNAKTDPAEAYKKALKEAEGL